MLIPFTFAGLCLLTLIGHYLPSAPESEEDKGTAFIAAQIEIQDRLNAPDNAEFISSANQIHSLGEHKYMLSSEVLAQNGFGARVRTPWRAWVHFDKEWIVDRVLIQ